MLTVTAVKAFADTLLCDSAHVRQPLILAVEVFVGIEVFSSLLDFRDLDLDLDLFLVYFLCFGPKTQQ